MDKYVVIYRCSFCSELLPFLSNPYIYLESAKLDDSWIIGCRSCISKSEASKIESRSYYFLDGGRFAYFSDYYRFHENAGVKGAQFRINLLIEDLRKSSENFNQKI